MVPRAGHLGFRWTPIAPYKVRPMQFHHDGFRVGDPHVAEASERAGRRPDEIDVLVVGSGPAGLTLAAQLAQFPDLTTRVIEQKPGPLQIGQADGVACRSMEMFEAFGFAHKVAAEAYWVNEVTFWRPDDTGTIERVDRIQDVEDGLSEMPHVILNQARVHDFFLEVMRNSPTRLEVEYDSQLTDLRVDLDADFPVVATVNDSETIRARYTVGCDGARSTVRRMLGKELTGEAARQLWGVMDVLAVTDFPDIRLKCAVQSATEGSLLIIPREGGHLVRLYIELDELHGDERAADRDVSPQMLIDKASAILAPHSLEVAEVPWWSAYEIGQRVTDSFDDVPEAERGHRVPRVFIAGDACHTHSPKAGQGMNVSMADAFNLGWKLASVVRGAAATSLLDTYTSERHAKAVELIEFDKDMARLFSERPKTADEAAQFQRYFQRHGRYTAGVETRYDPSVIVGGAEHQSLARGLVVGMRFHSAPVLRLADAKPMQLGHVLKADGRWRAIAFAPSGDGGQPEGPIAALCSVLDERPDIDLRAVFQQSHRDLAVDAMPARLFPLTGRLQLTDYENVFCPDPKSGTDVFDLRGIDRVHGALVLVRPDQYIAGVLPLDAHSELEAMLPYGRGAPGL